MSGPLGFPSYDASAASASISPEGDVALWLAEGLACYCEAPDNNTWQGVGELNPERMETLARQVRGGGKLLPLQDLVESDEWLRGRNSAQTGLLGYAQSWAL